MELLMMSVILGLAVACHLMQARLKRLENRTMQNEIDVGGYRRHLTAGIQQNGVSIGKLNERVAEDDTELCSLGTIAQKQHLAILRLGEDVEKLMTGLAPASPSALTIEIGDAECDHILESSTLTVEIDDTERRQ
jgi:hypothetical protein